MPPAPLLTGRTRRSKAKQTRLQFSPLPSSSPAKDKYSAAGQDQLANMPHCDSRHAQASSSVERKVNFEALPTPEPSSQPQQRSSPRPNPSASLSPPPQSNAKIIPSGGDDLSHKTAASDSEGGDEILLPSSKRRRTKGPASTQDTDQATPTRRSTRLARQSDPLRRGSASSSIGLTAITIEIPSPQKSISDLGGAETSGDDDDVMVTKPATRRRQSTKTLEDGFVVDDDRIEYISSEDEPVAKQSRPKKPTGDDWLVDDDEIEYISSEDEPAILNSKRQNPRSQKKKARTSRKLSRAEQQELEDDLEDLQDSDSPTKPSRTRGGPVTTQRDKARQHFELLRRRRAGEKVSRPEVFEEEEEELDPVDIDQIGESLPEIGSVHSSLNTEEAADGKEETVVDDDDFVVEDNAGRLGLPHPDIPLEFTAYATAKPRDVFIHVIEWLVKNKIAPAFSRHDQIWRLAFDKVGDQVKGQAGSRLISAAWNAEFKYSILARPNIKITYLSDGDDLDNIRTCDACNRTNHPARYDAVFSGEPYKAEDLEPVEEEDSGEERDAASIDEQGHVLPPQRRHFYLGRFCAANAEMGHKLTHWKYHLNRSLMTYLEDQGVLSPEAIVAREKLNKKKREREAEAIVDSMEATGVIRELWAGFQGDLDDARLGMEDFEKSTARTRGRVGAIRARGSDGVTREWNDDRMKVLGRLESDSEGE